LQTSNPNRYDQAMKPSTHDLIDVSQTNYCKRDKAICGCWLACAKMEIPACWMI